MLKGITKCTEMSVLKYELVLMEESSKSVENIGFNILRGFRLQTDKQLLTIQAYRVVGDKEQKTGVNTNAKKKKNEIKKRK